MILFPNKFTGNDLTASPLEQVMRRSVSDADIPIRATPHSLRHSFATHLMEQGVGQRNFMNCKTWAYGSNISVCGDCGSVQIHYNSCRNRCCPMCQAIPKEMWMDARRENVLDAPYFHLVFTLPDIINPVVYRNQKQLYDTLYHAASAHPHDIARWWTDIPKQVEG